LGVALEAMLDLLPLVKKEAAASAFRLLDSINNNFREIMDFHLLSDCMSLSYDLGVIFEVVILEREQEAIIY
jgi:hypothetical protein